MAGKGGGGAWKVAYADFVTAMMALFMVLWIMSQDVEILKATSRYFQNPFNSPLDRSSGIMDDGDETVVNEKEDKNLTTSSIDMGLLHEIAREFYRMLDVTGETEDEPVKIIVDSEGLKITIHNYLGQPFFEEQSAEFTEWGNLLIRNLAWLIESYQLKVEVGSFCRKVESNQGNGFDLTLNRANAARKALIYYALPINRITEVSGYGDSRPLDELSPEDLRNDRLQLKLSLN